MISDVSTTVSVLGNGKTLGLSSKNSSGTVLNGGLFSAASGGALHAGTGNYNTNFGTYRNDSGLANGYTVGIVQNASTSGITGTISRTINTCKFIIKY